MWESVNVSGAVIGLDRCWIGLVEDADLVGGRQVPRGEGAGAEVVDAKRSTSGGGRSSGGSELPTDPTEGYFLENWV